MSSASREESGHTLGSESVSNASSRPRDAQGKLISGNVRVKVLIDERGQVISAKALDGPKGLREASEQAAMKARFAPTLLEGKPVKVSGVITYNFLPK
jgi:protein TonB